MKYTIDFYSNWVIGSGLGGYSKDSIVLKDDNGLPFIPGKTLKGLIKDAFIACQLPKDKKSKKKREELFGHDFHDNQTKKRDKGFKESTLDFKSAYLPFNIQNELKHYLFTSKTATRIEGDKQVKNHSLRLDEVVIPLSLEAFISYTDGNEELSAEDYKLIEQSLKMLKLVGSKRYRGLGRCLITAKNGDEKEDPIKDSIKEIGNTIKSQKLLFNCTVTESLILMKKEKTEQNTASLDYIPGNTFRGIVAKALFKDKKYSIIDPIIFNGTVQFGDAHLLIDGKRSSKVPATFYRDKTNAEILNYHLKDDLNPKVKQLREGYFVIDENGNINLKKIEYGQRMKASRNENTRSSKKNGLFIYHYIKKDQTFQFEVSSDQTKYLKKVVSILEQHNSQLGKSKNAEFGGGLEIEYLKCEPVKNTITNAKYIYAESNLCFINDFGEYTIKPSIEQLIGQTTGEIDWEKSQIRFRTYMPYNVHRQNWDAERLIIEKGSVFVLNEAVKIKKTAVGCYLTEGFGNIKLQPEFLAKKSLTIATTSSNTLESQNNEDDNPMVQYLVQQLNTEKQQTEIHNYINNFLKVNALSNKVTSSQWGRVFQATQIATSCDALKCALFTSPKSICNSGLKKWNKKDTKLLEKYINELLLKFENQEKDHIALMGVKMLTKKIQSRLRTTKSKKNHELSN